MYVFINDQFVDEKSAAIGIADLSIQRGFGLFDFFRIKNQIPLFLEDYLDRFYNSAAVMRLIPPQNREQLKAIIFELISKNRVETSGIKMILTGGYSRDGFETANPNFIITQQPVEISSKDKFQKGTKVMLYEYLRDLPTAKSINYLMAVYLQKEIIAQKADDVLYYKDNKVLEFPRSNVFIVTKNDAVVTADRNVLHGITRKKVLEIAGRKFQTEERAFTVEELKNAAEVFLTSTTKRLLPVVQIDGKVIGDGKPGKITQDLYQSFLQLEEEYFTSYKQPVDALMQ